MIQAVALFLLLAAVPATAQQTTARFIDPTYRYDNPVLGKRPHWGGLEISGPDGQVQTIRLPESHVFEDLEPRLWDVDGDGDDEVVVILTDMAEGASLAVYDTGGLVAQTPYIGERRRWLAPLGVGDFDDDGATEIAFVDRPHMKQDLVFLRLEDGALREVDRIGGLTNHRAGMGTTFGGVRNCGQGDEVVLLSGDLRRIMAARPGEAARDLGHATWADLARALDCAF